MNEALPRIVIVGAGFGGLSVVQNLRGEKAHITVIDRANHHLFQPLLYQVATAGLSPAEIATPIRGVIGHFENTHVVLGEVTGVDTENKEVRLGERRIPYDALILATGSTHSYFGNDEWAKHAPGLKTINDAVNIRRRILTAFEEEEAKGAGREGSEPLTFVIVGGGPTGVELAGSVAELAYRVMADDFLHFNTRNVRIVLVEAGPRILASFSPRSSEKSKIRLEELGVEVRTNAKVEKIDASGVVIGSERIQTRVVIWAAGVVASPAGKWLGCECDKSGRVQVAPDLTVPGLPNVFVIGDTAHSRQKNGRPAPGVAPVAMQQGRYVANVVRARLGGEAPPAAFQYVDKGNLATIGRSAAVVEIGKLHLHGFVAWLTWLLVHIYYLVSFRNRLLVMIHWAWSYFTNQRGARLIVEAPPSLARGGAPVLNVSR